MLRLPNTQIRRLPGDSRDGPFSSVDDCCWTYVDELPSYRRVNHVTHGGRPLTVRHVDRESASAEDAVLSWWIDVVRYIDRPPGDTVFYLYMTEPRDCQAARSNTGGCWHWAWAVSSQPDSTVIGVPMDDRRFEIFSFVHPAVPATQHVRGGRWEPHLDCVTVMEESPSRPGSWVPCVPMEYHSDSELTARLGPDPEEFQAMGEAALGASRAYERLINTPMNDDGSPRQLTVDELVSEATRASYGMDWGH